MNEVINKFNNDLTSYYNKVMNELKFVYSLKNFLSTMDIKTLYPILDCNDNLLFSLEFKNIIQNCKNEAEKDYLDFLKYDELISQILKFPYFQNIEEKVKKLNDIKDNYEYGSFDYSFLTKFMMDKKYSISEINIVLSNYKPKKRNIPDLSFSESLDKIELPKRNINLTNKIKQNPNYIEVMAFIHSNYILYEKFIKNPKFSSIFTLASNYIVSNEYTYEEPIFISLFLCLLQKKDLFDKRLENIKSDDEDELLSILDDMKSMVERLRKLNIQKESKKSFNVINNFNLDISQNMIDNLKEGNLDYLNNISPLRISNIKKYVVRVNSLDGYSVSFIENEEDIIILCYSKCESIVSDTINFYNKHENEIDLLLRKDSYGR